MTKLRAAFHNFANALQKVGIYIKMSAAAKPSEVFLHLKREFKNVNPILTENNVIPASITHSCCTTLQIMAVNIVATDTI
jgi:hypothetical protein